MDLFVSKQRDDSHSVANTMNTMTRGTAKSIQNDDDNKSARTTRTRADEKMRFNRI